jgi:hypothetical protein
MRVKRCLSFRCIVRVCQQWRCMSFERKTAEVTSLWVGSGGIYIYIYIKRIAYCYIHYYCTLYVAVMTRLRARQSRNCVSFLGSGRKCFSSPKRRNQLWGPPSLILNTYRGDFSSGVKRSELDAVYSFVSSTGVNCIYSVYLHGIYRHSSLAFCALFKWAQFEYFDLPRRDTVSKG